MPDAALRTAKAWLREAVCECGHLDLEHVPGPPALGGLGRRCFECDCHHWRPVTFRVQRLRPAASPRTARLMAPR